MGTILEEPGAVVQVKSVDINKSVSKRPKKQSTASAKHGTRPRATGKPAFPVVIPKSNTPGPVQPKQLRERLGVTQATMARLLDISLRQVSALENSTQTIGAQTRRKLNEMDRLHRALSVVIRVSPQFLGKWFETPIEGFGGLKPVEVIERGEIDRIWAMIYRMGTGMGS